MDSGYGNCENIQWIRGKWPNRLRSSVAKAGGGEGVKGFLSTSFSRLRVFIKLNQAFSFNAAWAAASRAIGTRNGEQETYVRPSSWHR